jgi:solute:Na+ symporter, SSS family
VMIVVSYATAKPDYDKIKSLTFGTTTDHDRKTTYASWAWQDVVASAVVLSAIIGAYLYFRG